MDKHNFGLRTSLTHKKWIIKIQYILLALSVSLATEQILPSNNNNDYCGELKVFPQIWMSKQAITLSAQKTTNLSECITQCCNINGCNALTYIGFLNKSVSDDQLHNCLLFKCLVAEEDDLKCTDGKSNATDGSNKKILAREGVLSIFILNKTQKNGFKKNITQRPNNFVKTSTQSSISRNESSVLFYTTTMSSTLSSSTITIKNNDKNATSNEKFVLSTTPNTENNETLTNNNNNDDNDDNDDIVNSVIIDDSYSESSTSISYAKYDNSNLQQKNFAPVWVFGLAIISGIFFGGLSIAAISAYLCYKRQREQTNLAAFKPPPSTLHAFNPSLGANSHRYGLSS